MIEPFEIKTRGIDYSTNQVSNISTSVVNTVSVSNNSLTAYNVNTVYQNPVDISNVNTAQVGTDVLIIDGKVIVPTTTTTYNYNNVNTLPPNYLGSTEIIGAPMPSTTQKVYTYDIPKPKIIIEDNTTLLMIVSFILVLVVFFVAYFFIL